MVIPLAIKPASGTSKVDRVLALLGRESSDSWYPVPSVPGLDPSRGNRPDGGGYPASGRESPGRLKDGVHIAKLSGFPNIRIVLVFCAKLNGFPKYKDYPCFFVP
jgi:hypothetical protein